ncbi:MAG: HD-GYP domain-containing protein [Butyrivibrio sp.]|nr:HD-GYP domain-containing protein [Butyrivibrio sp.]
MRRVYLSELRPGMVLGEHIYSIDNEHVIVPKGSALNENLISKLRLQTSIQILIEDEEDESSVPMFSRERMEEQESLPDPDGLSHAEAVRATPEFKQFKEDFEETFSVFGNKINNVLTGNADFEPAQLTEPVMDLIHNTSSPSGMFDMLHSLRQYSDETYAHSVNVALIANALGQWMRLPEEDLEVLTQAGLLHDVGKLLVPREILAKPAMLSAEEREIIEQHPRKGYDLVKYTHIDERIKNAILMHHERCDGTGYPSRLTGDKIDAFAKYVAIADVYDAITSARVYRDALCPFIAIELMESEGLQKYDPQGVMTFMTNVVNVYLFNRVRLSDGSTGDIVFINRDKFSRPTVRVESRYIDLAHTPELFIEEII